MEMKNVLQQMIKLNQTLFNNAYDLSLQFQDQAEKLGDTILDQAGLSSAEYRKPYEIWLSACKAGRASVKAYVDEGYRNVEASLK